MNRPDETWHRLLNWTYGQAPSERLAAQILYDQKFTDIDPSHPLGGRDGGKDALCKKDGQDWIMAAYFPYGQQTFKDIQDKFIGDLAGVAKNNAKGIAFVTNQKLALAERKALKKLCGAVLLEVFHLERITSILDRPHMEKVRQQFLYIDTTPEKLPSGCLLASDWSDIVLGDVKDGQLHINGGRHTLYAAQIVKPSASIASLLTWSSRIPAKLIGRDAEMADLRAWAERDDPVRLRVMHGGGGVGKTRLAVEFGDALRTQGWAACLLSGNSKPFAFQPGQAGTLLIIDYPENYPQAVTKLFNLLKSDSMPSGKWRVLLLCRNVGIAQEIDQTVPHLHDGVLAIQALAIGDDAWELFQAGSARMREVRGQAHAPMLAREQFETWRDRDVRHADPLIILTFALNLLDDPGAHGLGRAEILQSLVAYERGRIERSLVGFSQAEIRGAILLKALAALTGGLTHADVAALKKAGLQDDEISLPGVLALKRTALWENGELPEMQPDILAAQLSHAVMQDYLATEACIGAWVWQGLVVGKPDDEQLRSRLRRLVRLSLDWTGQVGGQYCLIDALQVDQDMAVRLEQVFETDVQLEWPLFGLAVAVGKVRLLHWERQANADFEKYGLNFAASLNNLSLRLAEQGDRAGALVAIRRASEIYESLFRQNSAVYGPHLATSLNNLSLRLAAQGDRAGALAESQRAVTIYEDLSQQNVGAYLSDLAKSLNNLSNRLAEQGNWDGAFATSKRAVELYEDLFLQNFAAYGPALAMSLNNLAVRLAEQGDRAGALAAIQRAMEIREDLFRQNFVAYGPDLAMSLNNLAAQEDRVAALLAIQRAVEIDEDLARHNFAAYGPDLARSLNNMSVCLAEQGDRAAGLTVSQRAVAIYEEFSLQNFAAYGPQLALSLNNLSLRLAEQSDRVGSLAAIKKAVAIYEDLTRQNPAVYAPDLARSLAACRT
jgi:two-component sensor histidine kinase